MFLVQGALSASPDMNNELHIIFSDCNATENESETADMQPKMDKDNGMLQKMVRDCKHVIGAAGDWGDASGDHCYVKPIYK